MQTRQCRMTCKGLLTYLGGEVIVLHTSFRAKMGTFYLSLHGFVFQKCSSRFTENICTILNARALTAWRRKLDVTKESSCASVTNKFHSGKLCSAPPTKFFPYADGQEENKRETQEAQQYKPVFKKPPQARQHKTYKTATLVSILRC